MNKIMLINFENNYYAFKDLKLLPSQLFSIISKINVENEKTNSDNFAKQFQQIVKDQTGLKLEKVELTAVWNM